MVRGRTGVICREDLLPSFLPESPLQRLLVAFCACVLVVTLLLASVHFCRVSPSIERKFLRHSFQGGLGNQLFQFAASDGIAKANNMTFCIDSEFNASTPGYLSRFFVFNAPIPPKCPNVSFVNVGERSPRLYHDFHLPWDNVALGGWLESYKYFDPSLDLKFAPEFEKKPPIVAAHPLTVGVHLRASYQTGCGAREWFLDPTSAYKAHCVSRFPPPSFRPTDLF